MKPPPMLLGAALLFWGWQNGFLLWSAIMAVIVEGAQFVNVRWEFTRTDLNRFWDLCSLLVIGLGFIFYTTEDRLQLFFKVAQLLPFTFFPMILAQIYGSVEKIPLSVFSVFLRRKPEGGWGRKSYNISFLYFAICLLAASATNNVSPFFYPVIALLITFALLSVRPRRLPLAVWAVLIAIAAFSGQVAYRQMSVLQNAVDSALGSWISSLFHPPRDSREIRTSIGKLGAIALSGKIVMRVTPESASLPPSLLREATYDSYKNESWKASSNDFESVTLNKSDTDFLLPAKKFNFGARIALYLNNGRGRLALPHGTYELDDLPAVLQTNRLGVARVEAGPGLVNFLARYGPGESLDAPPSPRDLDVPENEKAVLSNVVAELHLDGMTDRQKLLALSRFFYSDFKYTLNITRDHRDPSGRKTPLGQFLTTARSGHCEYFATATVLLLRQAGIPARYTTGYAVPESALHGATYIVRERHNHAWAAVYMKSSGAWESFDTTPPNWDKVEGAQPPWWESVSDFFSDLYFQFSKWRWSKVSYTQYAAWFLAPLILVLAWRIYTNQRRKHRAAPPAAGCNEPSWPGMDSELYWINRRLAVHHLDRAPHEPLSQWQRRIEDAAPQAQRLHRIFFLHRRLRFDPAGISPQDRQTLKHEAEQWLVEFDSSRSHPSAP